MITRRRISLLPVIVAALLAVAWPAGAWTLDLVGSADVSGGTVRLADVTSGEIPAAAADLVVAAGGRPGAAVTVTSRAILRRLVMAGLADDVVLAGERQCRITFAGEAVAVPELTERIRDLLSPHVPAATAEAPPSWLAIEVPAVSLHASGDWTVDWPEARTLEPGRNLVTVQLREGDRSRRISVVAEAHVYARTAAPVGQIPRGQMPTATAMQWIWTDLATTAADPITDPRALSGMRAARDLPAGEVVTRRDLEPEPLVKRGELVNLEVRRGGISAVVRAECRQDGLLGETVSVLNKLTGRPVVARVAGPGVVTLGR